MEPIGEKYRDVVIKMMRNSRRQGTVTPDEVYQEANLDNRRYVEQMVEELMIPGSDIRGREHLEDILARSRAGESGLILMEHYSNFDIPCFYYLLEHSGARAGKEAADSILSIAGMKLTEESPEVAAFTEAYPRIVIYPSRSLSTIKDPEEYAEEKRKSLVINRAAMHELVRSKNSGRLILVFPAGTRFRPWQPETARGVKEIDSYLKSFENMVLVSVNGNVLRINPSGEMKQDLVVRDLMLFTVSPVIRCRDFRDRYRSETPPEQDPKQYVVDRVMDRLRRMHDEAEQSRQHLLKESGVTPEV